MDDIRTSWMNRFSGCKSSAVDEYHSYEMSIICTVKKEEKLLSLEKSVFNSIEQLLFVLSNFVLSNLNLSKFRAKWIVTGIFS
jgi:hypothetical protein